MMQADVRAEIVMITLQGAQFRISWFFVQAFFAVVQAFFAVVQAFFGVQPKMSFSTAPAYCI